MSDIHLTCDAASPPAGLAGKIVDRQQACKRLRAIRERGGTVVFTNGCFDMLEADHVQYLHLARQLGSVLVVGLNGDESVRSLKGPGRPIHSLPERALVLAGLASVDIVVPFDEPNSAPLLACLKPDVFVKGGDYTLESLHPDEREAVRSCGGQIRLIRCLPDRSTTDTISRAAQAHQLRQQTGTDRSGTRPAGQP